MEEQKLREFVRDALKQLNPNLRNSTTWLMYECVNELSDEELDEIYSKDIIDLAEFVIDEIRFNPSIKGSV